jgi:hypothetical protein
VHVEVWSPYKSRACRLQPHLASGLLGRRGREESTGTYTCVVETKVDQSAGSKASLALVGLMVPSHDMGFQKSSRALALSVCSSNALGPVRNPVLSQGAPASLVPLVWESKTPGWLVQDPTTRPIGDLIPTIRGSGAHPGRGWDP